MSKIIESRNVKIKDRVVTIGNIKRLSTILQKRYDDRKLDKKHCRVSFNVTCFDDSTFESGDSEIFSTNSILSSKRVSDISLKYISYEDDESIELRLSHGNYESLNYIRVSGTDSEWVNGVTRKLEEEIAAFKPQNKLLCDYKKIFEFVFALSIGSIYFFFIDLIPISPIDAKPPEWLVQSVTAIRDSLILGYGVKYAASYMIGIWPAYFLIDKLNDLWPIVEIQIGPEHTFIEKHRRSWIISALVVGIVPLTTSFIYDILKVIF